ncbi:MAG: protein translocase subunit SecF [Anaerolineae bacterium]|nr:protein translocase subunit SecF [Anaerolineae bacterium]
MFNIVEKRQWYFLISALIIIPGLVAMIYSFAVFGTPMRLGIDFTGGTILELRFQQPASSTAIRDVMAANGFPGPILQTTSDPNTIVLRTKEMGTAEKHQVEAGLAAALGPVDTLRYETVGPTVGTEVTKAASVAILTAAALIIAYILFSFRKVPNAFRYGVCAIVGMVQDILVTAGLFSLVSLILGWEADALFLTAILTVVGFSVQDKIVVFDRIRENIPKRRGESFETIVNRSLLETLHRSLATQLNAIFVLIAILLFGGATMAHFVAVLLVGMLSGTYSSIFSSVPLLVVWETGKIIGGARKAKAAA